MEGLKELKDIDEIKKRVLEDYKKNYNETIEKIDQAKKELVDAEIRYVISEINFKERDEIKEKVYKSIEELKGDLERCKSLLHGAECINIK